MRLKAFILILFIFVTVMPVEGRVYVCDEPLWDGFWIWAPRNKSQPGLDINIYDRMITKPGCSGQTLVSYIFTNAVAAGFKEIYWRLDNGAGCLLYPASDSSKVLSWSNWGISFADTDYARLAAKLAKKCDMKLTLVIAEQYLADAKKYYSGFNVVSANSLKKKQLCVQDWTEYQAVDKAAVKYLNCSPQFFRRRFDISYPISEAELCITAKRYYQLYIDGRLIGKDGEWINGETYNITNLLSNGPHVIAVMVEPDTESYSGLFVNMKYKNNSNKLSLLTTDKNWRCSSLEQKGWTEIDFDDSGWSAPSVVGFDGGTPWWRLHRPFENNSDLMPENTWERPLERIQVAASADQKNAKFVVDSSLADRSTWQATAPAQIELILPEAVYIRKIKLHSGNLEYSNNPSGTCSIAKYSFDAYINGSWVNLVPKSDAPIYRGQTRKEFVQVHELKKIAKVKRLRFNAIESYDTGKRAHSRQKPCVSPEKLFFIREIEVYPCE